MSKRLTLACLTMLCVAGCSTADDTACVAFRPLRLSPAAVQAMTRDDLLQVADHNDTWNQLCR